MTIRKAVDSYKKGLLEGFRAFASEGRCPCEEGTRRHTLWKNGWGQALSSTIR